MQQLAGVDCVVAGTGQEGGNARRQRQWARPAGLGRALASSVNRYLATLRSVLNHAVRDIRITVNPAAFVRRPAVRTRDAKAGS